MQLTHAIDAHNGALNALYLLQIVELQLKEMVKKSGLATTDELIRKHITSDIERASIIHTAGKRSLSTKDENDSMYEVFYFFLPRLTQMFEYMVKAQW